MSRISGKNTKPEMRVRHELHKLGFRYTLHKKELPGKPDLFLKKYNCAVFINGCFWHNHLNCKYSTVPKSNVDFWKKKIEDNRLRDLKDQSSLRDKGIRVVVVWECELKPKKVESTIRRIIDEIKEE